MTKDEREKFKEEHQIEKKLKMAEKELHNIEMTNDKSRRERWRELKKIIKYYKSI